MPFISQASIQEVTDRLDAVSAVSDYVRLEKKGGRFWACCPFHQEKTASFTVNPDMKSYYCFGCHKGGSIISFIMEMDKISFPEAIELLAKKASVELKYEKSPDGNYSPEDDAKKKEKEQLFELYQRIRGTFHHFLLKKPESKKGMDYIIKRGLTIGMIEQFQLGYAPSDRYWLYKFLAGKGYSREFLSSCGLFSARHPEASLFSGRIMFPIANRHGNTVAFGGRILPADRKAAEGGSEPPKYINSPELGIYRKRETLYAMDLALAGIRSTKTAYIAEGYMDVIALHQAGIINAIAPLGTAFTDEQAKLLKRWAEKIVFYFDSDRAGQEAAVKGIYTCRKNGLECFLVDQDALDEGGAKDPADILLNFGPEALQKSAKCLISDIEYLIKKARDLYAINTAGNQNTEGKSKAAAFCFPFLDLLESEVARGSCVEAIADAFGLLPSSVANDYQRYASDRSAAQHEPGTKHTEEAISGKHDGLISLPIRMNEELSTLIVIAVNYISPEEKKFFFEFRNALQISELDDPCAKEIFIALEECVRYGETGMTDLLNRISSEELKKVVAEKSASGEFSINSEKLADDGIRRIKRKRFERQLNEIIVKIRRIKKSVPGDEEGAEENRLEVRELLAEKMRIDNELFILEHER